MKTITLEQRLKAYEKALDYLKSPNSLWEEGSIKYGICELLVGLNEVFEGEFYETHEYVKKVYGISLENDFWERNFDDEACNERDFVEVNFPEFISNKPKNNSRKGFWWNSNDVNIRIKVLTQCIHRVKNKMK